MPSIILAWAVISIGVSYSYVLGAAQGSSLDIEFVAAACIATATGFVLHEMGHKFVAIRHGYVAHFQIWIWGIALALVTAVASGGRLFFGAPGAVYIAPAAAMGAYGYYSASEKVRSPEQENMMISVAGPGVNLAFAVFFLAIYQLTNTLNFIEIVSFFGLELNVVLGSFNMLPIPPLDGYKVFKNNIAIALAIALPLWGMFLYFFLL